MQFICIAEKYIYPDSNQFRDTPRIFVFDDAILWNTYLSRVARLSVIDIII